MAVSPSSSVNNAEQVTKESLYTIEGVMPRSERTGARFSTVFVMEDSLVPPALSVTLAVHAIESLGMTPREVRSSVFPVYAALPTVHV